MSRLLAALTALTALLCACDQEPAAAPSPDRSVVISGGGTSGVYYNYGATLAGAMERRYGLAADVLETGGSVENLQQLAAGESDVAFTAADAAADAVVGQGPFERPLPVRALARVYDDVIHLVTVPEADVVTVDDLRDEPVSLGAEGSGTSVIAGRLLQAAGIDPETLDDRQLGIDASIEALEEGRIAAFFWSGGVPTPGVAALAERRPIRLVALAEHVDAVSAEHDHVYRHAIVPRGTYGLPADVATMAVPNYLVVGEDADDGLAAGVLETLFDARAEMVEDVEAVRLLDVRRAIFTDPVELHPAAMRHYRDRKPLISDPESDRQAGAPLP